jgi:hypothetical protein
MDDEMCRARGSRKKEVEDYAMDKNFSTVAALACPVLIHSEGYAEWGNQAFIERFGIRQTAIKHLKVRELLWCLGIQDPLAGMIAEGVTFQQCEVPPMADADESIYLRQVALNEQMDGRDRRVLLISDDYESDSEDMVLANN